MKNYSVILLLILLGWVAQAQDDSLPGGISLDLDKKEIVLQLNLNASTQDLDKLLINFGVSNYGVDSLRNFGLPQYMKNEGWIVRLAKGKTLEICKPLDRLSEGKSFKGNEMEGGVSKTGADNYFFFPKANYGSNNFRKTSIFEKSDGKTLFFLPGNLSTKRVFLSGSFNEWSTLKTAMTKTDSGWVAFYKLSEGKHIYKFIVDGKWIPDLNNAVREDDGHNGYNSVYFKYNHVFKLKGYTKAQKVIVTGSFNQWDEKELEMNKTALGWELPIYLQEGNHAYKFIVDKQWINDAENPILKPDGMGNFNSHVALGSTFSFQLNGYRDARSVIVCGTFNNWNTQELPMSKTATGWSLPYILSAGNYSYKFIVDGQWIADPNNPHTENSGDLTNSILSIKPNTTFVLKGYAHSKIVRLSGTFNNWNQKAYTMLKKNGEWVIELYLPPNKYSYKFIVDGEWITDPANPHYEQNEWGTDNSVIWVQ